jgi:hypothetical protein
MNYKDLTQYATQRELDYIEALDKHGSTRKAAKALGVARSGFCEALARLKKRAALQGYSPEHDMVHTVPDGFKVKGVSIYYNAEGKPSGQWVKSSADADRQLELLKEFALDLAEGIKGLSPFVPAPVASNEDLMCVIPIGDPHFGMYAWAQESGADFDLDIAEQLTRAAIDRLVSSAPNAAIGLLLNLGDMFHADNQKNQTQSGHQLDVDGRWSKVLKVGLMAMIHAVNRMLEKFPLVIFRINKGNHDGHSSYALALMLSCYFHNNPRVQIELSPAVHWYFKFGKVLIASTHGDDTKAADLMPVMAADRPKDWGDTVHRYWFVGHIHHKFAKEYPGGIVEYMRTIAPRDAWHQSQGYRAGRDMSLIVMHKEYGEIERHRCDVGMIEG